MYKKNENIIVRKVLPSFFFVDISKCYNNDNEKMFITDEIGKTIWEIIETGDDFNRVYLKFIEMLTDEKTEEFLSNVKNDLAEYIDLLVMHGCLCEVSDGF